MCTIGSISGKGTLGTTPGFQQRSSREGLRFHPPRGHIETTDGPFSLEIDDMQTQNPILDEIAKLTTAAMGMAQAAGDEAKAAFRSQTDRLVAEMVDRADVIVTPASPPPRISPTIWSKKACLSATPTKWSPTPSKPPRPKAWICQNCHWPHCKSLTAASRKTSSARSACKAHSTPATPWAALHQRRCGCRLRGIGGGLPLLDVHQSPSLPLALSSPS